MERKCVRQSSPERSSEGHRLAEVASADPQEFVTKISHEAKAPAEARYRSSTSRVDTLPLSIWLIRLFPPPIWLAPELW